jgi:D-alanyl-D-alanine carboxypeptidase/D-alanyl-D-alanine-endopeptidase (penicillin-binding protein 4)
MKFARRDNMGREAHLPQRGGPRRWAALALVAALAVAAPARGAAPLEQRLARALAVPHVSSARTGAVAVDLADGRTVFARNEQLSLLPASTEKLAVAFAALRDLGTEFRIETDVLGVGARDGSTWRGDLVLKGFGDPTLSRADLRTLARGVRAFGITRVTGGVVGDESYFDAARAVSGWKPSYLIGESPPLSALVVDRAVYRGRTSRYPAHAAAVVFRTELVAAGVAVAGKARVADTDAVDFPLAFVHSPPLSELVRFMGVESDNFTAEMLLKQLGAQELGRGTSAAGAAVVTASLRVHGVPLADVRVVDGSGLSLLNRLTAGSLAVLLHTAWTDPAIRPSFLRTLAVAGTTGTLRRRLVPLRGRVQAKTGTTAASSALAGYVRGRYAFAVLHNGRPVATRWARRAQDRFVSVLAAP